MNHGSTYTRWLLTLIFFCLMGLLAVGMLTVHSKRTLRAVAVNIDRREAELEELSRRQAILNADLASSLNPVYLKQLIEMAGLELGPPREDRIILVSPPSSRVDRPESRQPVSRAPVYRNRIEVANNPPMERN